MTNDQKDKIVKHVDNLRAAFPQVAGMFPNGANEDREHAVDFARKLFRLENEGRRFAERCCNEPVSEADQEQVPAAILARLDKLIGYKAAEVAVFLNLDPRGCALKIHDSYVRTHNLMITRDWGGYGLIAPEL